MRMIWKYRSKYTFNECVFFQRHNRLYTKLTDCTIYTCIIRLYVLNMLTKIQNKLDYALTYIQVPLGHLKCSMLIWQISIKCYKFICTCNASWHYVYKHQIYNKKKSTDIRKRNLISIHASKTKHEFRQHFFLNM